MSSLMTSNVVEVAGITVPTTGSGFVAYSYVLWTVPGLIPSLIESVTFLADYGTNDAVSDVFEIALQAQNGDVLDRQPCPVIGVGGSTNAAYLTWSRGGRDRAQDGVFQWETAGGGEVTVWWRGSLPDFVVQQQGQVVLNIYRASDGGFPVINLSGIIVTYTAAATVSVTDTFSPVPLMVPAG